MSIGGSTQRLREDFEAQFEPVGDGRYLYRRSQRGAPIPVSSDERNAFIGQYVRRIRWIVAGLIGALLAFMGLYVVWTVAIDQEVNEPAVVAGTLAIAAIAIGAMYWSRAAPARALQGRKSVGRERSKDEMRAILFNKIRYGQLVAAAAFGVFLILTRAAEENGSSGWNRIWLLLGAGLVILAVVQAVRKWVFENQ